MTNDEFPMTTNNSKTMKKSEIKFTVTLDENNLPEKIDWSATDGNEQSSSKSVMIALWDAKENNTLRIDLWTKDMIVDEMKQFYHQCLLSMADTFERATGEAEAAKEMRGFAQHFGEKMELIVKKKG
jgi:gliding motility-associated protein GldC